MGRARSAIAAKCDPETLRNEAAAVFGLTLSKQTSLDDFDLVIDFCREHSEELGGEEGQDAWYGWRHGEWAILGDMSLQIPKNLDALAALSARIGTLVVVSIDSGFEYAFLACCDGGKIKRLLILEDEEIVEEGLPVPAERGQHFEDFDEEAAEHIWSSYGLPTFDYDPTEGPFACATVVLS
jgi:hypothetical protein